MHLCVQCFQEILPPSLVATYNEKDYHPECLKCFKCKKSLGNRKFYKDEFMILCEYCKERESPKCRRCDASFGSGETYKKVGGYEYHNDCFKCAGPCRKPITTRFVDLKNENFVCSECYDKYGNEALPHRVATTY